MALFVVSGTIMRTHNVYVASPGTLRVIVSVPLSVAGVAQAAASACRSNTNCHEMANANMNNPLTNTLLIDFFVITLCTRLIIEGPFKGLLIAAYDFCSLLSIRLCFLSA